MNRPVETILEVLVSTCIFAIVWILSDRVEKLEERVDAFQTEKTDTVYRYVIKTDTTYVYIIEK